MQNKQVFSPDLINGFNLPLEEKITYLESRIKKLSFICNEINPYGPLSDEFKRSLREFNIIDATDPFFVTNALLRLLEDSIAELHRIKPLSEEELQFENLR